MAASIRKWHSSGNRNGRSYMGNQPKKENTVAICHNKIHIGRLSIKMMANHQCLAKNCPYLEKTDHPYWEMRALKKAAKKLAREKAA